MAHESSEATIASIAAIGATLFPGIHGDVFFGAFAGSAIFVLSAKTESLVNRGTYGCISLFCGCMFHDEIIRLTPIQNPSLAAFILSVTMITVSRTAIEKLKTFDISTIWKKP